LLKPLLKRAARRLIGPRTKPLRGAETIGTNWARHYFRQTENYALEGFIYDTQRLVFTFEHAADHVRRDDVFRPGWGAHFFRARRVSHIAIKPKSMNWYRPDDLHALFRTMSESGFLDNFTRRVTYGSSMGGFAALIFADMLRAQTVVALNPQSTLDLARVPWEPRFTEARAQDWTGAFSDAAGHYDTARAVYLVYDPFCALDRHHADRITGPNVRHLRAPGFGHGLGAYLHQAGALPMIVRDIIMADGMIDRAAFNALLRRRKGKKWYFSELEKQPRVQQSTQFKEIIARARNSQG